MRKPFGSINRGLDKRFREVENVKSLLGVVAVKRDKPHGSDRHRRIPDSSPARPRNSIASGGNGSSARSTRRFAASSRMNSGRFLNSLFADGATLSVQLIVVVFKELVKGERTFPCAPDCDAVVGFVLGMRRANRFGRIGHRVLIVSHARKNPTVDILSDAASNRPAEARRPRLRARTLPPALAAAARAACRTASRRRTAFRRRGPGLAFRHPCPRPPS